MIIYDKNWLDKEISILKSTIKKDKRQESDTKIMFKCLLFCFFIGTAALSADPSIICPHCSNSFEIEIESVVKPGTWKCPNKNCGYQNDNRMRYCSICGTERQ